MIDVFNVIYEGLATALTTAQLSVDMSSVYTDTPEAFPHLSLIEADNSVYTEGISLDTRENYARVMLQMDVYSAKESGAKSEVDTIVNAADSYLAGIGFVRQSKIPTPNRQSGIYRVTARYAGIVSKGVTSGNNTVFNVYAL